MNAREKWNKIMNYQKVESLPLLTMELMYEEDTLKSWHKQGLPEDKTVEEYLGMDCICNYDTCTKPIPAFERKVIHDNSEYIVETNEMNCTIMRKKNSPTMYYGFIEHPVKNMEDWKRYKEHYDSKSEERNIICNNKETINLMNNSANPVQLNLWLSFFRLGFYLMGMERFMLAFYDMPSLIHAMFSFWCDFLLELIHPLIKTIKFDCASFNEDLAYKNGPHISPAVYREFWIPYQTPIINELKKNGIEIISMWTSGNIDVLIPTMMDNGFNAIWPLDRNSEMDPVRLRGQYGKELRLAGGIPKQVLIDGSYAIDIEIDRLMPIIEQGGFIPTIDDIIPPETPLCHYEYFINRLRTIRLS